MRRWIAIPMSGLAALAAVALVSLATGAPAQLVQLLNGTTVVSASNPLPVTNTSPAGEQDVNITAVGGNAVTTTVPVSGTVAATQSGAWDVTTIPSSASGAAIAAVVSTAVETGHVIKASAGNLYSVSVSTGASAGRVLIHNSTTVPAAGAVTPVDCAIVAANSTVALSYDPPLRLGTGISVSFSTATTCFTQTDSATAFISGKAS